MQGETTLQCSENAMSSYLAQPYRSMFSYGVSLVSCLSIFVIIGTLLPFSASRYK